MAMAKPATKGVPLDSGLRTPVEEEPDPFEEFNSITLHHDGEDDGIIVHEPPDSLAVGTAR
jgi:protein-serine/threonine kinase